MRKLIWHQWLILVVATVVFMTQLGSTQLWDRDEPRNAGCALEMLERSDWVVPVFNGELRTAKPVLLYWLMMASYGVFGVNEFAARFPSALLGIGTVLVTYHLGRKLFNPEVGLWSGLLLTCSLMFHVATRAATPDSALIFFSSLALMVFVYASFPGFPARPSLIVLMYAVAGLGVLAKGPVGLILPMAVIGLFLLIDRAPSQQQTVRHEDSTAAAHRTRRQELPVWKLAEFLATLIRPFHPVHFFKTLWSMWPLTALAVILGVSLPWYAWVYFRTDGEWVRDFLLVENVGRATAPMENHRGTPLFYPVALVAGFFPASILIGVTVTNAIRSIRSDETLRKSYVFLCCWVGAIVFIFTLAQTKLPSYITPTHPALALLTGCFVDRWFRGELVVSRWRGRVMMGILSTVGVAMAVGVYVAGLYYLPDAPWLWCLGLVLLAGAVVGWAFLETQRPRAAAVSLLSTGCLFCTALFGYGAVQVDQHQQLGPFLASCQQSAKSPQLATYRCLEPSWVFYSGQKIHEFGSDASAAREYLLQTPDHLLITTDRHFADLQSPDNSDLQVVSEIPYFMKKGNLVLVGRSDTAVALSNRGRKSTLLTGGSHGLQR